MRSTPIVDYRDSNRAILCNRQDRRFGRHGIDAGQFRSDAVGHNIESGGHSLEFLNRRKQHRERNRQNADHDSNSTARRWARPAQRRRHRGVDFDREATNGHRIAGSGGPVDGGHDGPGHADSSAVCLDLAKLGEPVLADMPRRRWHAGASLLDPRLRDRRVEPGATL